MNNNKLNSKSESIKKQVLARMRERGEVLDGTVDIEGIGLVTGEYYCVTGDMIRFIPNIGSEFLTHYKSLV